MTATASDTQIASELLEWYDRNARALPWRAMPGEPLPDPYRVWLSEIMLQQTTVAAVKPYFAKFTQTWPTVDHLAAAAEEDVLSAWAGLGYYLRARNLVKAARVVSDAGGFPTTESGLRKLPGVGDYTAAAITAIAFGQHAVVVDANVERVVARLFAIDAPLPKGRKVIREDAARITPAERSGDFAQAMMDLGATVCTARDARCLLCPLSNKCVARTSADPTRYPVKAPKKAKPERTGNAYWMEKDGQVWLITRPPVGMLGGMRALPDDGWTVRKDGSQTPPLDLSFELAGSVRHVFTHARLTLNVHTACLDRQPGLPGEWWPIDRLDDAGLPTLFAKAAARARSV